MKKIFIQLLILATIFSTIGAMPSLSYYDASAVEYVSDYWNGKWGTFDPDTTATRAQVASVFAKYLSDATPEYANNYSDVSDSDFYSGDITLATNLGLFSGAGGTFRPDDLITREEFAVVLVRAYEIAGVSVKDVNYATELIKDYDSISGWAKNAVTVALGNGYMVSGNKKMFSPSASVTKGELASAVQAISYAEKSDRIKYTVRDVTSNDNISSKFDVLQQTGTWVSSGIGGVGMIARFNGAPGEIYVKRDKLEFVPGSANMDAPVVFVKVTGPDGNVICRVDMDYKESGVMEKIINIPEGPAGIYQIQFNNGSVQTIDSTAYCCDKVTFGLKNPVSWGLRGEDDIVFSETTPKTGYIYIPRMFNHLSIGIAGNEWPNQGSAKLKLSTANGSQVLGETDGSTWSGYPQRMEFTTAEITPNTVYKYEIIQNGENFNGRIGIRGITPVIYESVDDALDLKSGYIDVTDKYDTLQVTGPLQKRARERMVEIYDELGGNFDVDISATKPQMSVPTDLDNPLAEAQLFAAYNHSISNIKGSLATQCLDPSNPWFGAIITRPSSSTSPNPWEGEIKDSDYPELDWQSGYYSIMKYVDEPRMTTSDTTHPFTGALTINSELNGYYNNPVLVKRAELACLYLITQLPADGLIAIKDPDGGALLSSYRLNENFLWGNHGIGQEYYYLRNFLSPKTRDIVDEGMMQIADKLMNGTGHGPTNQLLMCMAATVYTYAWSGNEFYHENAKRQISGMVTPCEKDYYQGQNVLGYFIESGGADGANYGRMNEGLWSQMINMYLDLPKSRQDPELVAAIIEGENKYLEWDSYFYTPNTENFSFMGPTNWMSRTNVANGSFSGLAGSSYLVNKFPVAKKAWLLQAVGDNYEDYETWTGRNGSSTGASILVSDVAAKSHLSHYMTNSRYDSMNATPESYRPTMSEMYYVWHEDQKFDDSQMPKFPYEATGDYNFFLKEQGIVAIKHKGLYVLAYFNNGQPGDAQSGISWMGGGPTTIWDDYFANTILPKKPGTVSGDTYTKFFDYDDNVTTADYTEAGFTVDEIRHSAIVGNGADGKIIISGREKAAFRWLENNRSFELKGYDSVSARNFIWNYYLTEDGVSIDGGTDTIANGDDLYMQIPILVQKGATFTFDETNKRAVIEHDGNKITYQWYNNVASLGSGSTSTENASNVKYLRLKLTQAAKTATIKITRTLAS